MIENPFDNDLEIPVGCSKIMVVVFFLIFVVSLFLMLAYPS